MEGTNCILTLLYDMLRGTSSGVSAVQEGPNNEGLTYCNVLKIPPSLPSLYYYYYYYYYYNY